MPKHFTCERVPVDRVTADPARIYRPFLDAYVRYLQEEGTYVVRDVPANLIGIPVGFAAPPAHIAILRGDFEELRRTAEEMMHPIAVLERADGILWSYDDTAIIALYHDLVPLARVRCVVIGSDPAPPVARQLRLPMPLS